MAGAQSQVRRHVLRVAMAWQHQRRPWVDARQTIGNIVISGTDASSNAMTESAIEEAHRAIQEILWTR